MYRKYIKDLNALALADIRTTKVDLAASEDNTLKLSGRIAENEKAVATQASYFDGRIEKLFVNFEGEEVRNGNSWQPSIPQN